jgi:hypothetical protein
VPVGPSGVAVLGHDVWVASVVAKTVTPIDMTSGTAGTPVQVLAGAVRVAGGFGALWVTGTQDDLTRVVPSAGGGAPAQTPVKVGQGPIGVATGAGSVWVADAQDGTLDRVNPTTLSVTTSAPVGNDPLSVAVSGTRVWVGFGTMQSVRTAVPAPPSKALRIGTTPRALIGVGDTVWVAGSNPGEVVQVAPPG